MIDECMAGNIDTVITKSISRFARNTIDCLKYIRLLKDKNIAVWFEKESINTMDSKGEVLITIMASLAQQESQSLSQNVKLGLQYRYQQGTVQVNHNHFLGYTKDSDGHLVIDPEQAEVVKRIYREYLEGLSMKKIAEGLEQDGILTGAGKTKWYDSTINKILQNEKYMGDRNTTWKMTIKPSFRRKSSCRCRRSLFDAGRFTLGRTVRSASTPATTASPRWSSAENAASSTGASTGTTTAARASSGDALAAALNPAAPP